VDGNFAHLSDESSLDISQQKIYGTGDALYEFQTSETTRVGASSSPN